MGSKRLDRESLAEVLFWCVGILILFWALGMRGLWASEGRWAEVTREMFLRKDFFHPTINGQPYFDKPLLTYWLVAGASFLVGRLNELATRLPSAVFALITIWATRELAKELWSREVGRIAGWLLLLTYGMIFWGRTAAAETENMAAIILATLWYVRRRDNLNFWTYLIFYLICFVGAHTKGLTSVVVPAVVVLPDLLREGRWKRLFSSSHIFALLIGAGVYVCPFVYADITRGSYQESGLALMFRENVIRFVKPFDHKGPVYLYLYYLPLLLAPFSPLILTGAVWMLRSYKKLDRRARWLIEATVLIFLFFTASGSRRGYYILPILPFCALAGAVFTVSARDGKWYKGACRAQAVVLGMCVLIFLLSPVLWPVIKLRNGFTPPAGLRESTFILGVIAAIIWTLAKLRGEIFARLTNTPRNIAHLILCAVILMGGFFCWQQPELDAYRTGRKFAETLRRQTRGIPPSSIAFYHSVSANIIFYLRTTAPTRILRDKKGVMVFACNDAGPRVLISRRKYLSDFMSATKDCLARGHQYGEEIYPWMRRKGRFYVAWKWM